MLKYIIKRLLWLIPVLLGVTVIVFTLMYITPGDTATILLGDSASPESVAELNAQLGLDQPYIVRLFNYIKGVVHLDLGTSYRTQQPVIDEIMARLPNTLILAGLATILATVIGVVTGIISAVKQYTLADNIATGVALFGVSMPPFWLGLLLILLFSVRLGILPSYGTSTWKCWILPTVTLGTAVAGIIMRQTRSSMLEVKRQDYIRTAKAKGQKPLVIILKHEFRNALIPIVTVIGVQFGSLMAGAILCENIFSISGVGKFLVDSINNKDYPSVMGTVLVVATLCSIINLLVDILYGFIDPRVKSVYRTKRKGFRRNVEKGEEA